MKMRLSCAHSIVIFLFVIASNVSCQNSKNRLSKNVTPSIYDLHIGVSMESLRFSGSETIYIHANQPTSAIELHALDLSIYDVHVIEGENELPITATRYNDETQIYTITLGQSLISSGNYTLKLEFEGEIKDDMKGLYRSSYYVNGAVRYMATTFSAAAYARKIFPCFDEPGFKAEFRLSVSNKATFITTLANTKVSEVETQKLENGEDWKTTRFEPTPVMSPYLLAFSVSDFRNTTVMDRTDFSVYSSLTSLSSMRYALDVGRKALNALEDYVGHNYTLGKMDFIAIDDFLMGAMENWGLVSFKSSRIMNPEGTRNLRKVQEIINIISHELVHMFFGNQVTCEYWDYVWLNEGFASYLEHVIADKIQPGWRISDYFLVNRMHSVMLQDAGPKTHAMTRPINTPDEISKIYDFVAYPKAASVIRMMEHIMTPEIFQKALNVYIEERSYTTATDEDLYEVLERVRRSEETETYYPPIPEIFRSWSNHAGYPILNVEFFPNNRTVKVSQELFVPLMEVTEPSNFSILYNYAASSNGVSGFVDTSPTNWIHHELETSHALDNTKSNEKWVIFNVQQTGYYRVNYDNRNWNAIIDELNSENYNSIHVMNRAQLLDDSFNLARYGYLNFSIALNLLKYLHRETELIPLTAGFKSIEFLIQSLDEEWYYENLRDILLKIVDDVYVRINNPSFSVNAEDEDYHVLTKLHVNSFACKIGAQSCLDHATSKLFLVDLETKVLPINERPYLYCGAVGGSLSTLISLQLRVKIMRSNGNAQVYRDNNEEFTEIFEAFSACDKNVNHIDNLLKDLFFYNAELLSYENISKENLLQIVSNLIKISTHRTSFMRFYLENFEAVNKRIPFKDTLPMFAEAIKTPARRAVFSEIARVAGVDVSETLSDIDENIHWMNSKASEIAAWVKNEKSSALKIKLSIISFVSFLFVMLL